MGAAVVGDAGVEGVLRGGMTGVKRDVSAELPPDVLAERILQARQTADYAEDRGRGMNLDRRFHKRC